MNYQDLLQEIRNFREAHAKKFDYDMERISQDIKADVRQLEENGWKFKYVHSPVNSLCSNSSKG